MREKMIKQKENVNLVNLYSIKVKCFLRENIMNRRLIEGKDCCYKVKCKIELC